MGDGRCLLAITLALIAVCLVPSVACALVALVVVVAAAWRLIREAGRP